MRKFYTFIGVSLFINTAICQPTFTAANFNPVLGEINSGFGFDTVSFSPGASGAGVTWNLSGLTSTGAGTPVTAVTVASTPYGASFPLANMAFGLSGAYNYFLYNSTGQYQCGEGSTSQVVSETDLGTLYTFPFTYLFSSTDSLHATFTTSGYPATRKGRIVTNADGYGTLQLPTGTYTNVMRIRMIWTMDETIDFGFSTSTSTFKFKYYYWIKPNTHFPLVTYLQAGIAIGASTNWGSSGSYIDPALVGVDEQEEDNTSFKLYPNPAENGKINLSCMANQNEIITVSLFDVTGKLLNSTSVAMNAGLNVNELNFGNLVSGVYFVKLAGEEISGIQKFTVK